MTTNSATTLKVAEARRAWPQIGDIIPNHNGDRPEPTADLACQKFEVALDDGTRLELCFESEHSLLAGFGGETHATRQSYEAFRIRDGLYFVDYVDAADSCHSISLVLDLARGGLLLIEGRVPSDVPPASDLLGRVEAGGSQSLAAIAYRRGRIGAASGVAFTATSKLSGQYLRYWYSTTHVYDHFYTNDRYYLWYCRQGPDAGLGDFEEMDYFEVDEDIYLVCWREKLLPCLAVMVEDHRAMRSIGKIYGVDAHSWQPDNTTVGATFQLLTTIPEEAT